MFARTLLIVSFLSLLMLPARAEPRAWTSSDGKSTFEGELMEFSATEVRIKRAADFQTFKVPLDKLSEFDQAHVKGLLREQAREGGLKDGPLAPLVTGAFVKNSSPEGLNYRLYGNPRWKAGARYPLVIWLHGAGQSGSDNEAQMGGSGARNLGTENPGVFAAIIPLCGGGDTGKAAALKETPLWAFHGDKDEDVPLERSTSMIEAIKAAGGTKAQITILEGEGHPITSVVYVEPELHEWIFAQRLGPSPTP